MPRNDDGPKGRDALKLIEERLGDLFGQVADALGQADTSKSSEIYREVGGEGGAPKAVFHSRVKVGTLDEVRAERSPGRPADSSPGAPSAEAERSLPRDIHPETEIIDGVVFVSCELPGVTISELGFSVDGQTIRIWTTGDRHYSGAVELPQPVEPEPLRQSLENGIYEARFSVKAGEGKS